MDNRLLIPGQDVYESKKLLDPATGKPFSHYALPPVLTYTYLLNTSSQTYSARARDQAIKFGRRDALAMEDDAFLMGIIHERMYSVCLRKWIIDPENPKDPEQRKAADFVKKIIERTPNLQQMLWSLDLAIWFGRAGVQMVWRKDVIDGRNCWKIAAHSPIRGDKIEFRYQLSPDKDAQIYEGEPCVLFNYGYSQDLEKQGAKIAYTDLFPCLVLTPGYWRERFVIHKHMVRDYDPFESPELQGQIHGYGIRDQIWWKWWLCQEWLTNVSDFIDQIGKGAQIFPYEAGNPASEAAAMRAAKEQNKATAIVWPVYPGQTPVVPSALAVPMAGSEVLVNLQEMLRGDIRRFIIGQSASSTSETSGMGTHDTGMQDDTKHGIIRWDCNNLQETMTEQVVEPIARWAGVKGFKLYWKFELEKPNAAEMMAAAGTLFEMGVGFKKDELRDYTGFSKPEDGDDVVMNPAFQQQAGPTAGQPGSADQPPDGRGAAMPFGRSLEAMARYARSAGFKRRYVRGGWKVA